MSTQITTTSRRRTGQILFMIILAFHALGCFAMGLISLFAPEIAYESGFQLPYYPELELLTVIIGLELLFLGSMAMLGIIWTRRGSRYGAYIGSAVGVYMFLFGFVSLALLGETRGLWVDSIRGLLTLVFAYMAYQELKAKK